MDYLTLSSKTTHLLVAVQRKMYDKQFCVPFQEIYEGMVPDEVASRYAMVIDGEVLDSKRVKYLTKNSVLALIQLFNPVIWVRYSFGRNRSRPLQAPTKARSMASGHELASTKYQLDQARYGSITRQSG